jgi:hypothetical protein
MQNDCWEDLDGNFNDQIDRTCTCIDNFQLDPA